MAFPRPVRGKSCSRSASPRCPRRSAGPDSTGGESCATAPSPSAASFSGCRVTEFPCQPPSNATQTAPLAAHLTSMLVLRLRLRPSFPFGYMGILPTPSSAQCIGSVYDDATHILDCIIRRHRSIHMKSPVLAHEKVFRFEKCQPPPQCSRWHPEMFREPQYGERLAVHLRPRDCACDHHERNAFDVRHFGKVGPVSHAQKVMHRLDDHHSQVTQGNIGSRFHPYP